MLTDSIARSSHRVSTLGFIANGCEVYSCVDENWKQSVQFSPLTDWVVRGTWGTIQQRSSASLFCRRPLWAVLTWAGMSTLDVVHPTFSLLTKASLTLQAALKDCVLRAVVACDIPEPCQFPSLDSRRKRFLWTYNGVDLAPHPAICESL